MRDSVPSVRYSSICNVLRLWRMSLIPTYRVYGLYDMIANDAAHKYVYILWRLLHRDISWYWLRNNEALLGIWGDADVQCM